MMVKPRGFALVATIGAVTLALLLLSAFLQSNRSFFTMTRLDQDRQACHEALLSLSEYLRFKLEEERKWGKGGWSGREQVKLSETRVLFDLEKLDVGKEFAGGHGLVGNRHLRGRGPEHDVDIHIAFSNNLDENTGQKLEAYNAEGDSGPENVPAKTCFIRMSARKGGHSEQAELALLRTAFFDSTLAASEGIDIVVEGYSDSSDAVVFNSRDPVRNQIRSGKDIRLPHHSLLGFRINESDPPPNSGTIWSKEDVFLNGSKKAEDILEAVESHNIEVVSQAKNHYNIPELTADDIELSDTEETPTSLTSMKYIFTQAEVFYEQPDGSTNQLQLRVLKEVDPTTNVVKRFHYNRNDVNAVDGTLQILPTIEEEGLVPSDLYGVPRGDDEFTVDDGKITVQMRGENYEEDGEIQRGATEPRIVLPRTAKADGPFKVEADDWNLVPTISFGDNEKKGFLSADGDLALEGYLKGGGKIVSRTGSVRLFPNDVDVESDQRLDLAVFAKDDVLIAPPQNEGLFDESEYGSTEFYFRGLIYAGRNFDFRTRQGFNRRLTVEGAVVARNGRIRMESQAGARLIYNPKYLDDFLEKSVLERQVQVEELSWRPL